MKNFERASIQFMKKKPNEREGYNENGNSRQTGDFGEQAQQYQTAAARNKAMVEGTLSS